jgi:hypothetical protein
MIHYCLLSVIAFHGLFLFLIVKQVAEIETQTVEAEFN